jgi:hypothetical protein
MPQITVSNPSIISKLQSDPSFRQNFMANATKTLNSAGYPIDQKTIDSAVATQLGERPGSAAASTVAVITVF